MISKSGTLQLWVVELCNNRCVALPYAIIFTFGIFTKTSQKGFFYMI